MSGDHNMYQKPRSYDDDTQYDEAQVQAMIKKAVSDEREACAKICEDAISSNQVGKNVCTNLAAAIRARGEK